MSGTTTPNYGFNLPTVGASRDTWGALVNSNFSTLDSLVFEAMPVGVIADFAGASAPSGWLLCDGRAVSRTTYSNLFAVLGTAWGAGDGSTTFNLPATPGRALVAAGSTVDANGTTLSYSFAQKSGVGSAIIAQANLPALSLVTSTIGTHNHGGVTAAGANHTHTMDSQGTHAHTMDVQGSHNHGGTTSADGAHYHSVPLPGAAASAYPGGLTENSGTIGGQSTYTSTDGTHYHTIYTDGSHQHSIASAGAHTHNNAYSGNLTLGINGDGSHSHTLGLGGSGTAMTIINPLLVCNKIIYAGQQAALAASGASVTSLETRRLRAPLRGGMAA